MKVIFLDFDGVLNCSVSLNKHWREHGNNKCVSPSKVERLNRIIEETGAVCVVSSTWRQLYTVNELRTFLAEAGFQGNVIDITPTEPGTGIHTWRNHRGHRGSEIQLWMNTNKDKIESFVILDDDDDMGHLSPFLVQTDYHNYGLQDKHVQEAIAILKKAQKRNT